jgi:lipopolysaccharide biosynthesis glycosyltransferase
MRDAVCLCVDRNMVVPACFVADAVKRAAVAAGSDFDVVVVTAPGEISAEQKAFAASRGLLVDDSFDTAPLRGITVQQKRLSPATLFKLLLAEHFGERYRRILYLDADLTIHGDVGPLFRLDLGEHAVAAVPSGRIWFDRRDWERRRAEAEFQALGMTPPYRFVNTGVLLIHPANWRRDRLGARILDFVRQHPALCRLPDEHALNAVLDGRLLELSPVWNLRPDHPRPRPPLPVIVHYAGSSKPWRRFQPHKGLFEQRAAYRLYAAFIRATPWPGWLRAQWTWRDLALALRHEVLVRYRRWRRPSPLRDPARRAAFEQEVREQYRGERFVDVRQGIVVEREGRLRRA